MILNWNTIWLEYEAKAKPKSIRVALRLSVIVAQHLPQLLPSLFYSVVAAMLQHTLRLHTHTPLQRGDKIRRDSFYCSNYCRPFTWFGSCFVLFPLFFVAVAVALLISQSNAPPLCYSLLLGWESKFFHQPFFSVSPFFCLATSVWTRSLIASEAKLLFKIFFLLNSVLFFFLCLFRLHSTSLWVKLRWFLGKPIP